MPQCYLLSVVVGSSLDQQSHNVTLFNLVEQVNVPADASPEPGSTVPLEIHAYFQLAPEEIGQGFQLRFALTHRTTGLETYSEPASHRGAATRMRTRSHGLPFPPSLGHYELRIDFRAGDEADWSRDPMAWPLAFLKADAQPRVMH